MAKHPPVNSAKWYQAFSDENVTVLQDENDSIFFKVTLKGQRPKYFYNETAHSDVARYCADELGIRYWSVLDQGDQLISALAHVFVLGIYAGLVVIVNTIINL